MKLAQPDEHGRFGVFGGRYVPETVVPACVELERAWRVARRDRVYLGELRALLRDYVGRPTALTFAPRLSKELKIRLYLKREDLCHTGAHKINNTVGQVLLARRMGKRRIIAETGAGQHGVATATVAALFGLECVVYMGEEDIDRQALNVFRMRLMGARVVAVTSGTRTLKDATSEAIRDWATNVENTYYVIGSAVGPHPYPWLVRELQSVIGREARRQILARERRLPDCLVACVGGGSNSSGFFFPFLRDRKVRKVGVEAAGFGLASGQHGASLERGRPGVLHGSMSYVLQDADGQILPAHSISAGLDYPGSGPELSSWKDSGDVEFDSVTDDEALDGFQHLAEKEGIIPALETAHAVAWVCRAARRKRFRRGAVVLLNLSGRGDKDVMKVSERIGERLAAASGTER
jgi:tryptophan synthase beta chain